MLAVVLLVGFVLEGCGGLSNTSIQGVLVSEVSNKSVAVGGSVTFSCVQHHIEGNNIVWRRGFEILSTGELMISGDRRVVVDFAGARSTLMLSRLQSTDQGEYVCQVSTIGQPISTSFYLDVQVPPSVWSVPESGHLKVREGDTVELLCNVSGNPAPSLSWSRHDTPLPTSPGCDSCLRIAEVGPQHSGAYDCSANNGIQPSASAVINLHVEYPPVVHVEEESIATGLNQQVVLTCFVDGDPPPPLSWNKQDGALGADSVVVSRRGRAHTLRIPRVTHYTLGNYSCTAINKLGSFKKHLEVHGRPGEVDLRSAPIRSTRPTSHHLTWRLTSHSPVTEYRLLFRILAKDGVHNGRGGDWTNVIIPGAINGPQAVNLKKDWVLQNLVPEATFECLVQARNKYGWSKPSPRITFNTNNQIYKSASTQNLGKGSFELSNSCADLHSSKPYCSLVAAAIIVVAFYTSINRIVH